MMKINVNTKMISGEAVAPEYATLGSSGCDLKSLETFTLKPGARHRFDTGLTFNLPEGYEAQVRSRSGLAHRHGVCVAQGIGTIDNDYTGEVKVILINFGDKEYIVNKFDKIAQLVLVRVEQMRFNIVENLADTERGEGGFGHSGVN